MDLAGTQLGKYELGDEIGRGGMGVVYRGYDPTLERPVAVKVLAPHLKWEEGFVERFMREARTAARLKHPHIVTIHDVGEEQDHYYFVMEYLPGQSLNQILRQQTQLSPEQTLSILRQLADALDHAHEQGLVHRDVKPANVIVDQQGHVTLTDFGLVHAARETRLTATGAMMGTPQYMSPEQVTGEKVGPPADLYSLAILAYEMLSGSPPFSRDTTPALLHMQVYDPPPSIVERCPNLPPAVEKVINQALAKNPAQRFPSAQSFVEALALALESEAAPTDPASPTFRPPVTQPATPVTPDQDAPPPRRIPWPWLIGGGLAVAALLVLVILSTQGGGEPAAPPPASSTVQASPTPSPPSPTPRPSATRSPTSTSPPPAPPTVSATATFPPTDTPPPTATATPGLGSTRIRQADGAIMVYVPAGPFLMGSDPAQDPSPQDEQPQREIDLSPFWIDRTEVSVDQFRTFAVATSYQTQAEWEGASYVWTELGVQTVEGANWQHPFGPTSQAQDEHPVTQVSWQDAQAYCQWAGGSLPSEAQWEKAARGTEGQIYPWGDDLDGNRVNFCDVNCPYTWQDPAYDDGYERTAPVDSFPQGSSPYGALNMAGNVWEWVLDCYAPDFYASAPSNDPVNLDPDCPAHALKGGSWDNAADNLRAADRNKIDLENYRNHSLGFRCAIGTGDE